MHFHNLIIEGQTAKTSDDITFNGGTHFHLVGDKQTGSAPDSQGHTHTFEGQSTTPPIQTESSDSEI